jgi:predicted DNA-binding transcriptional regulator AlpA
MQHGEQNSGLSKSRVDALCRSRYNHQSEQRIIPQRFTSIALGCKLGTCWYERHGFPYGHYHRFYGFAQRSMRLHARLRRMEENIMKTFEDKIERLKSLKETGREQRLGLLLEPLLTTSDLQQLLKVDRRTILRMVKRGDLPRPLKLGGNRWRVEDIEGVINGLANERDRVIATATCEQE